MAAPAKHSARNLSIWIGLAAALSLPVIAAAQSPLLAWRDPIYIAAGFAGIVALALLLLQPVLVAGYLPGVSTGATRRIHRWSGAALVLSIVIHVGALWITSPPDVVDALLFVSPTPFSDWGVIAMWAIFASALLGATRTRFRARLRTWRISHSALAGIIVIGSVVHTLLIDGTMETVTKYALCALVLAVTAKALFDFRAWAALKRR